ncbi:MAG: hypothetical protein GFH27_549309n59 [Chloroflexi bacterium AL-W]|nr:hypothetical protein [Chloroflexi bacterium AL-N1]NOK69762.1 hypothetical protein [Chloroflexi bacterium AL-N10]NOK73634.1 hypothetical protein [Chloroflexi bacterium AL-N5]NOK83932.1 hypothetical protein [Chloroflexi bacterium AL-W]NOK87965.1 hypothetical protein [Chloroflexi bacterium AL-N15]
MTTLAPQQGATTPPRPVTDPAKVRRKGIILTVTAIVLAIAGGIAVTMYVGRLEAEVGIKETVVVATEPIAARQQITEDLLTTVELPVKYLAPSYILDINDLIDGNTTALINIAPGEYVQQNMVSRNAGLEPGSRAVSIPVNGITSVGNSVRQGNYVDIVLSYVDREGVLKTEFLLQNIKVLAVDTLLPEQGGVGGVGGQTYLPAGADGEVELAPSSIVTVELTPEQALEVSHATNFGKELRLIIRRLDEEEMPNIDPVEFIGSQNP